MNNLTPLQEIASRIYCLILQKEGFIAANSEIGVKGEVSFTALRKSCIIHAKALLEATKPEPLEVLDWEEKQVETYAKPAHYSNTNEFEIAETNSGLFVVAKTENVEINLGWFNTLDEAKQFAEFIRTRQWKDLTRNK
jgi:hypothetical protein